MGTLKPHYTPSSKEVIPPLLSEDAHLALPAQRLYNGLI